MPLRDHFHPPLGELRHWESFHARWATVIADTLEADLLPPGYFAEVQVHVGNRVEVDVATFEDEPLQAGPGAREGGATATATLPSQVWAPPEPGMVLPAVFPDRLEVQIFNSEAGPTLVAAIELVSPRNKDRGPTRRAFATKCASYLQQGIGLVLVDIVTNRRPNLHNEMIRLLELGDEYLIDPNSLYAVAYRPVQREENAEIQVWPRRLAVGEPLSTLPLPLDKGQCLRLDLEETYAEACRRTRLPDE
jgi:hypothetical protein